MTVFQLSFYIPNDKCEAVKLALFEAGAGKLGNYEHCSWQTHGVGQFKPLSGSQPFIGKHDKLETVDEIKVEMLCVEQHIEKAIKALKKHHPYEEVAYFVTKSNY